MNNKTIEDIRKERLERTEVSLRLIGAEKCIICKQWMDKEYLINGICDLHKR